MDPRKLIGTGGCPPVLIDNRTPGEDTKAPVGTFFLALTEKGQSLHVCVGEGQWRQVQLKK